MENHELFLQKKFKEVAKIIPPNSKVLDIGCNEGKIRRYLVNPNYFGVDLDNKCVELIKKEGFHAQAADLNQEEIPFKKEKFDYILLLDIVEHVVDPRRLILSTKKLLNPQGKIIITLPNDYHLINKIRFIFNKPLTEDVFSPYGHLHYFPIKVGEDFLISNGLKIIKKTYLPPTKPKILPQFVKDALSRISPQNFSRDVLYVSSV
jgi:2-polyprenyl-3-methyl-5-hydroxy-6-metoxy-1,4-benzoquinol methylase